MMGKESDEHNAVIGHNSVSIVGTESHIVRHDDTKTAVGSFYA